MGSVDETSQACQDIMREAVKLALGSVDSQKVVDAKALVALENQKCTGFLMLFFTEDQSGHRGTLDVGGGEIPPKVLAMLMEYYPGVAVKLLSSLREAP